MIHNVHYLTVTTLGSRRGWVAPVELPADQPQDGALVVPVSDVDGGLFSHYRLECNIYRGSGQYDRFDASMDLQKNETLKATIDGRCVTFVRRREHGKAAAFEYIGQLTHADFNHRLCEIEAEDEFLLDELYDQRKIILAGCEPEAEYGNLSTFLASPGGRQIIH